MSKDQYSFKGSVICMIANLPSYARNHTSHTWRCSHPEFSFKTSSKQAFNTNPLFRYVVCCGWDVNYLKGPWSRALLTGLSVPVYEILSFLQIGAVSIH